VKITNFLPLAAISGGLWNKLTVRLISTSFGDEVVPRRKKGLVIRPKLSSDELEARIMALIQGGHRRIKGITIIHVGSFGTEPNWYARPNPSRVSMREFVSALAKVRKEFDLLSDESAGAPQYRSPLGGSSRSRIV